MRDKHKVPIEVQKQVDQYVRKFPFTYDYASVQLPVDGLGPQPIIPIINGMACQQCTFKIQSRTRMRQHANEVHNKKRAKDKEILRPACLQSWFGKKREQY